MTFSSKCFPILLFNVFISGCASVSTTVSDISIEEAVVARAAQRWESVIKGEYLKAYEFFSPSIKAIKTQDAYAASFGRAMRLESAEKVSVNCTNVDRCLVTFKIGAIIPVRGFTNQTIYRDIEEVWLLEDGKWGYFEK